jgi:hypothetical protein
VKGHLLAGMALFAVVACAQQPSTPPTTGAAPALIAASYAAGSAANTTTSFDATYTPGPESSSNCANYKASTMVISNGLAQFDLSNMRFQGYVTPQGSLAMRTAAGQSFAGQVNSQGVITGRVVGPCAYDGSWIRQIL